jgi:hypothetical protein
MISLEFEYGSEGFRFDRYHFREAILFTEAIQENHGSLCAQELEEWIRKHLTEV